MPREKPETPDLPSILLEAVNNLPDGFVIYDADFRILLANRRSWADFGPTLAALDRGEDIVEAHRYGVQSVFPDMPDDEAREIAAQLAEQLQSGNPVDLKSPTGRVVQVVQRPLSFGGAFAIGADITELRERQKELKAARTAAEAASEAKSSFLANISHEIRTPLNGIIGMAQVLAAQGLEEKQKEQVDAILESGRTLMAILNDVLDLSKIEAGRFEISSVNTDLHHGIRSLMRLWRPRADEKNTTLSLSISDNVPRYMSFDPVRARQCVSNLVSNAIKFTENGTIDIAVDGENDQQGNWLVSIRIADTGIGMNEETLNRLFEPFTQADSSTSRSFGGTGLGLSITRRLARLMGGDVTVTSEPDKGSVFTLTFAASSATGEAGKEGGQHALGLDAAGERPWGLGRKVLAAHGGEAIDALEREPFDLVLLDAHMPVMDGPATIARIRGEKADWRTVPVIMLTADAMAGDRERYLAMGVDGYAQKPIDQREFFGEVARVLIRHLEGASKADKNGSPLPVGDQQSLTTAS
jgi:signal transduction histidine kinase/CheY-like chemotaxis protein